MDISEYIINNNIVTMPVDASHTGCLEGQLTNFKKKEHFVILEI